MDIYGGVVDDKLSGSSLNERYRSLNGLVTSSDPLFLSPENLARWTDKSQADQIYIVKLADRTKNTQILLQTFQSENLQLVAHALKATWLFEGQTDNDVVNADYFINNVFPSAAFRTVRKIISLFGAHLKNESLAQDLYVKIQPICNHETAVKLLPKCSVDFIRSIIMNDCFKVPIVQLVYIYKKDVNLALEYVFKSWRGDGAEKMPMSFSTHVDSDEIWLLYAKDYPVEFMKLFETEHKKMNVRFGARITSDLIKIGLDNILQKSTFYVNYIHIPTLLNVLKGEKLDNFVLSIMPDKEDNFNYSAVSSIIKHFKQPYRLQYLMKIYALKYNGASVLYLPDFLNWGMESYIPSDLRDEWAYKRIEMIESRDWLKEEHFLKYINPEKALPRLMTLCRATSDIDNRITYLEKMIDCCSVHNDEVALLKVLKYTAQRHRNDLDILRYRFLNHVLTSFKLHSLSHEHWEVINEMIEFMIVNKEIEKNSRQYFLCSILEQYLHYCMDNSLPYETVLDQLLEYNVGNINLLVGVANHEKVLIDILFERYKAMIDNNTDNAKRIRYVEILTQSFNKRSDGLKCSPTECEWLTDMITDMLKKNDVRDMRLILSCLKIDLKSHLMFADKLFESDCSPRVCEYYLKYDPSVITRNISLIFKYCMYSYSLPNYVRFFHSVRAYMSKPFGELSQKMIEDSCTTPENEAMKAFALSLILNIQEGESLIKKLVPTETKVDLSKHKQEYLDGELLARSFMFINPPISYETLSQFAKDDYLKFTLPALLSLSFKKSSADSLKFIKELVNKPVSIKKHGVRLAYFQFPRAELLTFFKQIWDTEKNVSIREVVFQRTYRLLQTETDPSKCREIWEVIRHYFKSFGELDNGLFHYLGNVRDIRPELLSSYCQTCWETLKRLRSEKVMVDSQIVKLSSGFIICMQHLSVEFCESLVKEYMYSTNSGSCESQNLLIFLVYYLVNAKTVEQQNANLHSVCNLFKKNIEDNWNIKVDKKFVNRDTVIEFVLKCCSESLNSGLSVDPVNLLNCILDMLSALPKGAVFDLRIMIELCISYRELIQTPTQNVSHSGQTISKELIFEFGSKIGQSLVETCENLGNEIFPTFFITFNSFFNILLAPSYQKIFLTLSFISGLLSVKSNMCYVMAVTLLPTRVNSEDGSSYMLYMKLMKQIKDESSLTVKILMDKKFSYGSDELFN